VLDEKKRAKAEKLARKGRIDDAVRMHLEAGYPSQAAWLLKSKGRYKEAGELFRESKDHEAEAVRCFLAAGLEDEARKIYVPVPESWSSWSDLDREYYEGEDSKLWYEHIQKLIHQRELKRALKATLNAEVLFGQGNWGKLVEVFRNTSADTKQPELWAQLLLRDGWRRKSHDEKGNVIDRTSAWEVAMAFFRAGLKDDAFETFNNHGVDYPALFSGGWCTPKISGMIPDCLATSELPGLVEFLVRRYVAEERMEVVYQLVYQDMPDKKTRVPLWQSLSEDLQMEVIKKLLTFRFHSSWAGKVPEDKSLWELARSQGYDDELSEVLDVTDLYLQAKLRNNDIEECITSYAEQIERYDAAILALERLGHLEDAIAFLDETPSHLIWPYSQDHEKWKQNYREKLEFKLKRARESGIAKEQK
jgi:hypothetical protein